MNRTSFLRRAALLAAVNSISQLTTPIASADSTGGAGTGFSNTATGDRAFVGGGYYNANSGGYGTIGGGYFNANSGLYGTLGGGQNNKNSGFAATIGGGLQNANSGAYGTIGGGQNNNINSGFAATIGGGYVNTNSGFYATIGGGERNVASTNWATIGGGYLNTARAQYATVPGGVRSKALHSGSFVWSGVNTVDTVSTSARSFTARAPGGVRFITVAGRDLKGARLLPNATAWTALSDRESKTDFQPIQPREVLSKLAAMPVTSWQYKHDPSRRYIGPTSQDFMAAFHLGQDDKGINTLDADGVTFAAIKGLVEELKERDKAIEELKAKNANAEARNEQLSTQIEAINERLNSLPPAP